MSQHRLFGILNGKLEKDNYIYHSEIRNIVSNKEKEKMDKLPT